ncbi:MAG: hypothetical protein Q4G02_01555 [bacterium]|nr:hypothetical protein [bacterium]
MQAANPKIRKAAIVSPVPDFGVALLVATVLGVGVAVFTTGVAVAGLGVGVGVRTTGVGVGVATTGLLEL